MSFASSLTTRPRDHRGNPPSRQQGRTWWRLEDIQDVDALADGSLRLARHTLAWTTTPIAAKCSTSTSSCRVGRSGIASGTSATLSESIIRSNLKLLNLRGYATDANVILPRIAKEIHEHGFVLIIIDPLYKILGDREENATKDMADLMLAIERLAVDSSAAVFFGAHFSKGNQSLKEAMDESAARRSRT